MDDPTDPAPNAPLLRLLDQVRARIRVKQNAIWTEKVYVDREGKGSKDRRTMLPEDLVLPPA